MSRGSITALVAAAASMGLPVSERQQRAAREEGAQAESRRERVKGSPREQARRIEAAQLKRSRKGMRLLERVGKKTAGRELDGRLWDEFPRAGSA